jgi:O-antigen ligase
MTVRVPSPDETLGARPPCVTSRSRLAVGGLAAVFVASLFGDGLYDFGEWGALVLIALALASALVISGPWLLTTPGAVALSGLTALLVWSAISVAWSPGSDRAWLEVHRLTLYTAVFTVAVVGIRDRRTAQLALDALGLAALAVSAYVLARMLGGTGGGLFTEGRLNGPMGYVNGQAGLFIMAFWVLLARAERATRAWQAAGALGGAVLLAHMVVLTQARAAPIVVAVVVSALLVLPGRVRRGWLLVLVGALTAAALPVTLDVYGETGTQLGARPDSDTLRVAGTMALVTSGGGAIAWGLLRSLLQRVRSPRGRVAGAIGLVLIALAGLSVTMIAVGDPRDAARERWRSFRTLDADRTSRTQRFTSASGYRYDLWRIAIEQFESHPLRGVGAGNYDSTYYRERRSGDYVRQPHSLPLQMLGEMGLPGGIAIAIFALAVVWAGVRPPIGGLVRDRLMLRVGALGAFLAWFLHTSIDWLYNIPALTGFALLAAGVLVARSPTPSDAVARSRMQIAATIAILVSVAFLAAATGRDWAANRYLARATARLDTNPDAALVDIRRSLRLNDRSVPALIAASAAHARRNEYVLARRALHAAADREPYNYAPWALLGDLATRRGDLPQARADYARAHALNPHAPLIVPTPPRAGA